MDHAIIAAITGKDAADNCSQDNSQYSAQSELEKLKVLSTAEMVSGSMELVALQLAEQPEEIQPRWKAYIVDAYHSSVVLREHLSTCRAWYAAAFLRLLPANSIEPVAQKISAQPDA